MTRNGIDHATATGGASCTGDQQASRPGVAEAKTEIVVVVKTITQKPEPTMKPLKGPTGLGERQSELEGDDSMDQSGIDV